MPLTITNLFLSVFHNPLLALDYAFQNNHLLEVKIEDNNLVKIENGAFKNTLLKEIIFPDSIIKIGAEVSALNELTKVVLPKGIKETFLNNNLVEIQLLKDLEIIGKGAFEQNELTSIALDLLMISDRAFAYNKLEKVQLTNTEIIGTESFRHNNINTLKLPTTLKVVEPYAFSNNNMVKVNLKDTQLESIKKGVFFNNAITSVITPSSLTSIEKAAFMDNSIKQVILNEGLKEVGSYAFYQNELSNITLPSSVIKTGINIKKESKAVKPSLTEESLNTLKELKLKTIKDVKEHYSMLGKAIELGTGDLDTFKRLGNVLKELETLNKPTPKTTNTAQNKLELEHKKKGSLLRLSFYMITYSYSHFP